MTAYPGQPYSNHLSVEGMVRLHTEAVTRYLGDERKQKLEHVAFALRDFMTRCKQDPTIDTDQIERAVQLQMRVEYDLSQTIPGPMAEEDASPNEP